MEATLLSAQETLLVLAGVVAPYLSREALLHQPAAKMVVQYPCMEARRQALAQKVKVEAFVWHLATLRADQEAAYRLRAARRLQRPLGIFLWILPLPVLREYLAQ